jgi:hypothetical protein
MTGDHLIVGKNAGKTQTLIDQAVAERCAPLVEFVEFVLTQTHTTRRLHKRAHDVLAAYHAAQGAGRGDVA